MVNIKFVLENKTKYKFNFKLIYDCYIPYYLYTKIRQMDYYLSPYNSLGLNRQLVLVSRSRNLPFGFCFLPPDYRIILR